MIYRRWILSDINRSVYSNLYPRVVSRLTRIWHSSWASRVDGRGAYDLAGQFIYRAATQKIRADNLSYLASQWKSGHRVATGRRDNTNTTTL